MAQYADSVQTPLRKRLQEKVVLVTGGGTGIGRAAVLAYAREGAKVVLAGRRWAEIEATRLDVIKEGGDALAVVADITQEEDIRRLLATVTAHYGRLDIAFNNAGILGNFVPIHQQTSADFDAVIATNLRGVWLSIKYQVETFLSQNSGGVIVNTSSWLAKGALAGSSSYSASKGALDALIRAVALEYGEKAIRINNINPGIIDTPMAHSSISDPSAFTPFIAHTPTQRLGLPEDIADVAVWLSTDDARFITGQSLLVDGGYTIAGMR
ncbi:MAG: glucose 1-dehydrogenase [Serratia liquefaciens]|nr:glucose 1-dehydrogenase [Serratia liquefaciens]